MSARSMDISHFYAATWSEEVCRLSLPHHPEDPKSGLVDFSRKNPVEIHTQGALHTFNLQVAQSVFLTRKQGREVSSQLIVPGHVSLVPEDQYMHCVLWPVEGAVSLNVHFSSRWLAAVRDQHQCPVAEQNLPHDLGFWHPQLRLAALQLVDAIHAPIRPPRLCFDEFYFGLAVGILHVGHRQPSRSAGRLAPLTLRKVIDYMHAGMKEAIALEELAAIADLSPFHFARSFKTSVGIPPHRYLTEIRLQSARTRLIGTDEPLSSIGLSLGFGSSSHFSTAFRAHAGISPAAFRDVVRSRRPGPHPRGP